MSSERIVLLGIMTALMFAVFSFSQSGLFILPFGLYKPGVFIVSIALLINERRKLSLPDYVMLLWALSLALSSRFIHQLFISEHQFITHSETIKFWSSLFMLIFYLLFFFWQILLVWKEQSYFKWLQMVNALVMFAILLLGYKYPLLYFWIMVPTMMWITSVFMGRTPNEVHRSMAGMMAFVILSVWFSALYFGMPEVLNNL